MDVNSFKTYSARPADVERRWYIIDVKWQPTRQFRNFVERRAQARTYSVSAYAWFNNTAGPIRLRVSPTQPDSSRLKEDKGRNKT